MIRLMVIYGYASIVSFWIHIVLYMMVNYLVALYPRKPI